MHKPENRLSVGFLYDDTLDSSDGVAQYVKTLGSWLSQQGHDVCYLVGETTTKKYAGATIYSLARNARVVFNGNRLSIPVKIERQKIRKILRNHRIDVLHVMLPYSPLMTHYALRHASPSTAVVGTFHVYPGSILAEIGGRLLRQAVRSSLRYFDAVVSVSQPAADYAWRAFKLNSNVVPNAIDVSWLSGAKRKSHKTPNQIVFLGRLVKRKGCMNLLKAFLIVHKSLPNVRLTIAGDGPERPRLERFVRKNGLRDAVKFVGHITEKDKPALLASADIACFPSLYGESFGIVLVEAMAAGAGVVLGGDNPGYRSVLQKKKELLIDSTDTKNFAIRLQRLLTDSKLLERLNHWQSSQIRKYDVENVGKQIERLYRQAIAKREQSRHN